MSHLDWIDAQSRLAPAILLHESFRGDGRVSKRTGQSVELPTPLVEGFGTLLKGGVAVAADGTRRQRGTRIPEQTTGAVRLADRKLMLRGRMIGKLCVSALGTIRVVSLPAA